MKCRSFPHVFASIITVGTVVLLTTIRSAVSQETLGTVSIHGILESRSVLIQKWDLRQDNILSLWKLDLDTWSRTPFFEWQGPESISIPSFRSGGYLIDPSTQSIYLLEDPGLFSGKVGQVLKVDLLAGKTTILFEKTNLWSIEPYVDTYLILVEFLPPDMVRPNPAAYGINCILDIQTRMCDEIYGEAGRLLGSITPHHWIDAERFVTVDTMDDGYHGEVVLANIRTGEIETLAQFPDQILRWRFTFVRRTNSLLFAAFPDNRSLFEVPANFYKFDLDSFELSELPYQSLPYGDLYSMQLSPDEQFLFYQGPERAAIVNFDSGRLIAEVNTVEEQSGLRVFPRMWLPDGSGIIGFTELNREADAVIRINRSTGAIERLFDDDNYVSFIVVE